LLNDGVPTLIATASKASSETVAALRAKPNVEVVLCGNGQVDLPALMELLAARGLKTLIVEGGSTLLSSLFGDAWSRGSSSSTSRSSPAILRRRPI